MKTKPDLSFWKLWDLSFGFFGVQIAYALQSANVSRIFTTIGADPHELSYFWILPPLMGLIVQPIVGLMSDRTWNRFGRRLPYLIFGALIAVIVMCALPNAGSLNLSVSSAILFGLVALMLLDTSINMAMQPFKMLVGDMVNEKQKSKAYSIQSFLCNAGSVMGYVLPLCLTWIGIKNFAPEGVVPPSVIWAFYLGAAILLVCVVYSLIKIKEWPPKLYNEYNGVEETVEKKKEKTNIISLLKKAPSTFWSVGLVQFFCWFAFLFLWTYVTNTVAHNAFSTPEIEKIEGITDGDNEIKGKFLLIGDNVIVDHGTPIVKCIEIDGETVTGTPVIINGNDTIVKDNKIALNENFEPKVSFNTPLSGISTLKIGDKVVNNPKDVKIEDYLYGLKGSVNITTASVVAKGKDGKLAIDDASTVKVNDASKCSFVKKTVLNSATPLYNEAANHVGLLYAVQALASVLWALILPKLGNFKFSYSISLLLGAIGFVCVAFITNQYLLYLGFILIGCAWAAMLAWPFTILTNSLHEGNIGTYLGLFNCTICIPQIVAALAGGWILSLLSTPGELAPEYLMMMIAGISIAIGAVCVFFIKTGNKQEKPVTDIPDSEAI